jgi:hypothetical protein
MPIARWGGTAWHRLGAHEQLVTRGTTFTFLSVLARRGETPALTRLQGTTVFIVMNRPLLPKRPHHQ